MKKILFCAFLFLAGGLFTAQTHSFAHFAVVESNEKGGTGGNGITYDKGGDGGNGVSQDEFGERGNGMVANQSGEKGNGIA